MNKSKGFKEKKEEDNFLGLYPVDPFSKVLFSIESGRFVSGF